ncbi:hypothetical protein B0H11DRAFT_2266732 [Mycena galericulata]|nr:hypothetical protein B0H11DRAFT_2266732 [Mycena galericulata]
MTGPKYRCSLPYYPDPGQPDTPADNQKLYLVTGTDPNIKAGAYPNWNSGGGNSQGISLNRVQGYLPHERDAMQAAWYSACDRGEHDHPADPNLKRRTGSVPLSPRAPGRASVWTPSPSPAAASPARASPAGEDYSSHRASPARAPAPKKPKQKLFDEETPRGRGSSGSKPIDISSRSSSPAARAKTRTTRHPVSPPGLKAYGLRCGLEGWVYADLNEARDHFHRLQAAGKKAQLATATGFTRALAFAERVVNEADSTEGRRRTRWAEEEAVALWDTQRAAARRAEILEELAVYREGESVHSSDEDDSDRFTDDLQEELDLHVAHNKDWREYRGKQGGKSSGRK